MGKSFVVPDGVGLVAGWGGKSQWLGQLCLNVLGDKDVWVPVDQIDAVENGPEVSWKDLPKRNSKKRHCAFYCVLIDEGKNYKKSAVKCTASSRQWYGTKELEVVLWKFLRCSLSQHLDIWYDPEF